MSSSYIIRLFREKRGLGILIIFIVIMFLFDAINKLFFTPESLSDILLVATQDGIIAIFVTLLLIGGEFDLSVGEVFVFSGMIFGYALPTLGPYLALLLALVISAIIGLGNGLITTYLRVPSFITTLGTSFLLEGLIFVTTGGFEISVSLSRVPFWYYLSGRLPYGFNMWIAWFIIFAVLSYILLEHTRFGNHIFATGGSQNAAYAVGVNTRLTKIILFIFSSTIAGLVGIMSLLYYTTISPVEGQDLPLIVLAIAVIGGSSLFGGVGSVEGTVFSALTIGAIYVGLVLAGVPSYYYYSFVGALLVSIAIVNEKLLRRKVQT
ncbi:ABC transporter permease [Metallosphaera javensis (ex Sakai et al. 2022)]|uniref:ABC transporter permease n=1 Tax=Metallosphaera javensis (ex Sakai et al. 2022) TaxID=2775498 RepID=UPI00258BD734|nr:MAG: sugar ABC transporter permease [Metallosphaera javensis (ex Sakai et al. 2022)]